MIYRKKQYLGNVEEKLSADIIYGEGKRTQTEINNNILDQFPTATITTTNGIASVNDSSNLPLKDIQVLGNATQADTPTPTTPQAIHVVTGDNTVKVVGKNLLDNSITTSVYSNVDSAYNTLTSINTGIRFKTTFSSGNPTNYIKLFDVSSFVGKTIRITANFSSGAIALFKCNADASSRSAIGEWKTTSGSTASWVVDNLGDETFIGYRIRIAGNSTVDFTNLILTVDNVDMTYEPYQEQSVTLPLGDIELAGIPNTDYKDRIFKAEVGNAFYDSLTTEQKATLTLGKWYLYKAISSRTLTGSSNWSYNSTYNMYVFTASSNFTIANSNVVSKIAISGTTTSLNAQVGNNAKLLWYRDYANYFEGNIETWKTFLNSTNEEVYYPRITPTITEITDTALITALEAIYNASTYKNTTNFSIEPTSTNATGDMTITYRQDISSVLSTIATLEARVELLEQ